MSAPNPKDSRLRVSAPALMEVEKALDGYREVVCSAGLAEKTETTYLRHAEAFVRSLRGDFEPGSRASHL